MRCQAVPGNAPITPANVPALSRETGRDKGARRARDGEVWKGP